MVGRTHRVVAPSPPPTRSHRAYSTAQHISELASRTAYDVLGCLEDELFAYYRASCLLRRDDCVWP